MSGFVKFVTTVSQDVAIMLEYKFTSGPTKYYIQVANALVGWSSCTEVTGDVLIPLNTIDFRVYFRTDSPAEYLLDDASVTYFDPLANPNFELSTYGWYCLGPSCTLTSSQDAHQGSYSVLVSARTSRWNGAAQDVDLTAGAHYRITGYVKLNSIAQGRLYQDVELMLKCTNSGGNPVYTIMGKTPRAEPNQWHEVGGIVKVPEGTTDCLIYFQTDVPGEYHLDTVSLQEVTLSASWKTEAATTIDSIRKADIIINVSGTGLNFNDMEYQIVQTSSEFIWGSAVAAREYMNSSLIKYQEVFNENFEWAVLENALKWDQMEKVQGDVNYNTSLTTINALLDQGKKIRGHCTFWGVDQFVQGWVKGLTSSELETAISDRIQGVIGNTTGLLKHWDVNNENQHGDFYERNTSRTNVTEDMFNQINAIDGDVKLYINDYAIISSLSGGYAVANKDQAVRFLADGIPLSGIGIQGHMYQIDLTLIKNRLDMLAEVGVPLLITELGINDANNTSRASKLSDLLYMFFSHPAVEGVMFWGFWDGRIWEKDAPLFNGPNVTANAAGEMFMSLRQQWTTNVTASFNGASSVTTRGFKGDYSLKILQGGSVVASENFTLTDGGTTLNISL